MDRQHRHDLKHDKFVDEIGVLTDRARANQRLLLSIALGLVLIAVAAYALFHYRTGKEAKAQLALASAIETIEAPVSAEPQPNQPQPTGPTFKTADERNTAAEKQFRDVHSKFGGTDAADIASLYLARLSVSKGDVAGARKGLETFIDEHGEHPLLGASARYSLYQLRIENGEAVQVANEIDLEMKKAKPALPGDALLILQAQAYDVQGNAAKSRESYRRIMNEYPESQYAVEAARRAGQA